MSTTWSMSVRTASGSITALSGPRLLVKHLKRKTVSIAAAEKRKGRVKSTGRRIFWFKFLTLRNARLRFDVKRWPLRYRSSLKPFHDVSLITVGHKTRAVPKRLKGRVTEIQNHSSYSCTSFRTECCTFWFNTVLHGSVTTPWFLFTRGNAYCSWKRKTASKTKFAVSLRIPISVYGNCAAVVKFEKHRQGRLAKTSHV